MGIDKWEQAKDAAIDAVKMTLDNRFDVIQTAKDLNDKYGNDSDDDSDNED